MPLLPRDAYRPSAAQARLDDREQYPQLWHHIDRLKSSSLARWRADDLEFFLQNRQRFLPVTAPTPHPGLQNFGSVAQHPPALTRLRVEPRFGIAWIGIASIVTVAGLAIYHGSRHEREARKAGR